MTDNHDNEIALLNAQVLYWQQKYEKLKIEHENMIKQNADSKKQYEKYVDENYVSRYLIDKALGRDF